MNNVIITQEDKSYETVTPGSYAAVCVGIIDLGTQITEWEGEKKQAHKVMLNFELEEKMLDGRPFVASREFTLSLHEKSALRAFITAMRGRNFTPDELKAFDMGTLLGDGCLASMVLSKNEKYVNLGGVSQLPKGMKAPKPHTAPFQFEIHSFDKKIFDSLYPWVRTKIELSPEYMALNPTSNKF